ncbi:hypothetical protein [Vibrio sp. OPT18]|uniref:hypothetical protein n=1 Tax=Vibrio sp. OPT18 TaxID=2778641 RepID=UPI001880F8D3|nr:hypothetical protein [Vibrio sp. OPT18]MBE8578663.1 hypothetical protein [Vibrio sp. OPT18]
MAQLPALFLSATEFAKTHQMGVKQVYKRLDLGDLPEVEREAEVGKRYVNLVLLAEWLREGKVTLSNLSNRK